MLHNIKVKFVLFGVERNTTIVFYSKSLLDLGLGDLLGGGGDVRQPGNLHSAGPGVTDCST